MKITIEINGNAEELSEQQVKDVIAAVQMHALALKCTGTDGADRFIDLYTKLANNDNQDNECKGV